MAWFILFIAGLLEIVWATGLKETHGLTRHAALSGGTIVAMVASLLLLGYAMRHLPMGTAYAVWTGIGSVGTVLLGILLFGESASLSRLVCIGLIVAGILGLKFLARG